MRRRKITVRKMEIAKLIEIGKMELTRKSVVGIMCPGAGQHWSQEA